jgi:hypothetical protein
MKQANLILLKRDATAQMNQKYQDMAAIAMTAEEIDRRNAEITKSESFVETADEIDRTVIGGKIKCWKT